MPVDEAAGLHWAFHEMLPTRRCRDLGLSGERDQPWEWEGCDGAQVGAGWMLGWCWELQEMMGNSTVEEDDEELSRQHLGLLWAELLRGSCVLLESVLKV